MRAGVHTHGPVGTPAASTAWSKATPVATPESLW